MDKWIINFLEDIEDFMENPVDFYAIFYYLPFSAQYLLIYNIIMHKYLLVKGDAKQCIMQHGEIVINDKTILLLSDETEVTLLELPKPFEI